MGSKTVCTLATIGKQRKNKRQCLPVNPKWRHIGTVKEISIYPIQSGAALQVRKAKCTTLGLRIHDFRDRSLVLFNEHDEVAFSGTFPSMLSISTEIENESSLIIRAPNREPLSLDWDVVVKGKTLIEKQGKGMTMRLIECDRRHHEWFSSVILQRSEGLKLYISLDPLLKFNVWGEDQSDFNPIMVMNNKSLDDLNTRLTAIGESEVHHLQFRGNILVEGLETVNPYDEDNWSWLKIGDSPEGSSILHYRAPCKRCISPNVNIRTYKHSPRFQPLKILKRYRLVHDTKEPTMGAYYNVHTEGVICVNAPVYVAYAD